jgi:hypothetical protein
MAYNLTVRGEAYLAPGLIIQYGDFTCNSSDTLSIEVPGAYPVGMFFANSNKRIGAGGSAQTLSAKASGTTGTTTLYTVTASSGETDGRFLWLTSGY